MPSTPARKFGLLDVMILIVAVAVGLAVHIQLFRHVDGEWFDHRDLEEILNFGVRGITFASSWLAVLTMALIAIGLRKPRPILRRLARRPGTLACWSAMLMIILIVAPVFVLLTLKPYVLRDGSTLDASDVLPFSFLYGIPVGAAVAISWTVGRLAGRWHGGGGWIEWAGRGVGVAWLVVSLLGSLVLWADLLDLELMGWNAFTHRARTVRKINDPITTPPAMPGESVIGSGAR